MTLTAARAQYTWCRLCTVYLYVVWHFNINNFVILRPYQVVLRFLIYTVRALGYSKNFRVVSVHRHPECLLWHNLSFISVLLFVFSLWMIFLILLPVCFFFLNCSFITRISSSMYLHVSLIIEIIIASCCWNFWHF